MTLTNISAMDASSPTKPLMGSIKHAIASLAATASKLANRLINKSTQPIPDVNALVVDSSPYTDVPTTGGPSTPYAAHHPLVLGQEDAAVPPATSVQPEQTDSPCKFVSFLVCTHNACFLVCTTNGIGITNSITIGNECTYCPGRSRLQ